MDELIPECPGASLEEAAFRKDCDSDSYGGILRATRSVKLCGKVSIYVEGKGDWQGATSQRAASSFSCVNGGSWLDAFAEGTQEASISLCFPSLTLSSLNGIALDWEGKPKDLILGVLIPERKVKRPLLFWKL